MTLFCFSRQVPGWMEPGPSPAIGRAKGHVRRTTQSPVALSRGLTSRKHECSHSRRHGPKHCPCAKILTRRSTDKKAAGQRQVRLQLSSPREDLPRLSGDPLHVDAVPGRHISSDCRPGLVFFPRGQKGRTNILRRGRGGSGSSMTAQPW